MVKFPKIYSLSVSVSGSIANYWDAQSLSWRILSHRALKDDEIEEYISLLSLLNSYTPFNGPDSKIWSLESSGCFSVASDLFASLFQTYQCHRIY